MHPTASQEEAWTLYAHTHLSQWIILQLYFSKPPRIHKCHTLAPFKNELQLAEAGRPNSFVVVNSAVPQEDRPGTQGQVWWVDMNMMTSSMQGH